MTTNMEIVSFIRRAFLQPDGLIPLHAPKFSGNERKYVLDAIDSTFVSSVGAYVTRFEAMMVEITGGGYAIATVNGTAALHLALMIAGVSEGDEVITQPLTFVATANAVRMAGGTPIFIDVDKDTLGMSPASLEDFLSTCCANTAEGCINKTTGKRVAACVPMHTFGFPLRIDQISGICQQYGIALIEDAAESLGSFYKGQHTGTFGLMGAFSFNGNKTVTCGGGGAIITSDDQIARKARHLSTTAKIPHVWEYDHDEIGYNYRMPNLNAAMACAQLEQLPAFLENKRKLANLYRDFFSKKNISYVDELPEAKANYWLNALMFDDQSQKESFLADSNANGVMTRPIWKLMNKLGMYKDCQAYNLVNAEWLEQRVVNIPSSVR